MLFNKMSPCKASVDLRCRLVVYLVVLLLSLLWLYYIYSDHWIYLNLTTRRLNCYEKYASNVKQQLELDITTGRIKEQFQVVGKNGSHSYVYSAYIDDRVSAPDISADAAPVVRVMTWLRRRQRVVNTWRCLLWFQDVDIPFEVDVISWTDLNTYDTDIRVIPVMLICPYRTHNNTSSTQLKPLAVSVVPSSCHAPQNVIPLSDMRQRLGHYRSDKLVLTAADQAPLPAAPSRVDKFPFNFTVCLPLLYGNRASDLVEFIEVNRVFGAQRFIVYIDSSRNETELFTRTLRHYERTGIVELHHWTLPADIESVVHYHGQILLINDCLYRVMYVSMYVLFQDLDELVVPTTADDWMSMLEQISRTVPKPQTIASYSFRHRMIPAQLPDDVDFWNTSHPLVRKFRIKALLKTTADAVLYKPHLRPKVMARPDRALMDHVHSILDSSLVRRRLVLFGLLSVVDRNMFVDSKFAELHHYRESGWIESNRTTRLTRMHRFESRIVERFEELIKQGVIK